jgi:hypothetical protein
MQNGFTKKEKQAKVDAKEKAPKAGKSKAGDHTDSTNNNVKRFKLSDTMVNGLTTDIMLGDSEACIIAKRWLKNAKGGLSDLSDNLEKDSARNWVIDIWT